MNSPTRTVEPSVERARVAIDDGELVEELAGVARAATRGGRRRVVFPHLVRKSFDQLRRYRSRLPLLRPCYSVKTNPRRLILEEAKRAGCFAEVIGAEELAHALSCGFSPQEIVYNGPVPAAAGGVPPGYVFADSIESYVTAAGRFPQTSVGVRVRPPGVASHFGIPHDRVAKLGNAVRTAGRTTIGVSFHVRPQDYGAHTFRTLVTAVMQTARDLERCSGAFVEYLDVGGGWRPAELDRAIARGDFEWLQEEAASGLARIRAIFCEPGQSLVTASEAVVAPILEVRVSDGVAREIVVDAGYPDVPQIASFPHRLFVLRDGGVFPIRDGPGKIIGRTCLEYDVLSGAADLSGCRAIDAVAIADAGAYDSSMSFSFADGRCGYDG